MDRGRSRGDLLQAGSEHATDAAARHFHQFFRREAPGVQRGVSDEPSGYPTRPRLPGSRRSHPGRSQWALTIQCGCNPLSNDLSSSCGDPIAKRICAILGLTFRRCASEFARMSRRVRNWSARITRECARTSAEKSERRVIRQQLSRQAVLELVIYRDSMFRPMRLQASWRSPSRCPTRLLTLPLF